ncbi:MAG: carbohydrate kinase, partial [Chloroflexi bacterium]
MTRQWQGCRVLVIGDIVADEHVTGRPHRIAREAPVLVLEHTGSTLNPGGATNVAA